MRLAILAHDKLGPVTSKTGTSIIRYGRDKVVAVIDRSKAGDTCDKYLHDIGHGIPIVASMREAMAYRPQGLAIGIAPVGGALPSDWRRDIRLALSNRLKVVSGLHAFLADDAEFARLSKKHRAKIVDVRRFTGKRRIATGEARKVACPVVYTHGTDCSSGKMTTAVEIVRAARERGVKAMFAATGQTGIMIGCDAGAPIDAIVSDFAAGAAEELVLKCAKKGAELIVVEGQGTLAHPAYSGVTLSLLHGSFPDFIVVSHDPRRPHRTAFPGFRVLSPSEEIRLAEAMMANVSGGRAVGVALMGPGMTDEEIDSEIKRQEADTNLPCTDPVRYGAGTLVDAILEAAKGLEKG
ncbi:MAG: DUF1611 domain-containing protein [Methanobacteriota archaeon]